MAAVSPSPERGKELFNSVALGTNGKSCASCHPGGKGLEKSAASDPEKLAKVVNRCIVKALKGKALPSKSPDLASLVSYLKTIVPTTAN
ncbi:cytochrome C [Geobacter sp. FeAm09]|nr:cytochrome C [Geobacter sp. FeAm09]